MSPSPATTSFATTDASASSTSTTGPQPQVTDVGGEVRVDAGTYRWAWRAADDGFTVHDTADRLVVAGNGAPVIVVDRAGRRVGTSAVSRRSTIEGDRVHLDYDGINGAASVRVTWRFDDRGFWIEPLRYATNTVGLDDGDDAVVSVTWFATPGDHPSADPVPGLRSAYLVHPGICEAPAISPIVPATAGLDLTTWLGRGASGGTGPLQQWGLPAHWFAGFHADGLPLLAGDVTDRLSAAFCCGAAELPAGDLMLRIAGGRVAPLLRLHGDRWDHRVSGGTTIGPRWRFSFGADDRSAVGAYQRELVDAGAVPARIRTPRKDATLARCQFNTWGAQTASDAMMERFDQTRLTEIYDDYLSSGIERGLFVIDDKWEGRYGVLEHDPQRFPDFEPFLDRVRADGHAIGLWAAFLRCDDPAALGLGREHMLAGRDGTPIVRPNGYRLYDVTRPDVAEALADCVRRFMRRYAPALVKFDFGYELPSLADCCPSDPVYAGERLLGHALDLVVGAMRDVDPDVAVMYYALSPLLSPTVDLIATDDLFLAAGEFCVEANRRLYYSSVLGELGMPSYGSSGYDGDRIEQIWFDSVAAGPIGSLGSFASGRPGAQLTARQTALYNGLARLARSCSEFRVQPLGTTAPTGATGAYASSWIRYEDNVPVLAVLRPDGFAGAPGVADFGTTIGTDATTAIATTGIEPLGRARRLRVVTDGPARLDLRHDGPETSVTVTGHSSGGTVATLARQPVRDGHVTVEIPELLGDGSLLEHADLTFE